MLHRFHLQLYELYTISVIVWKIYCNDENDLISAGNIFNSACSPTISHNSQIEMWHDA